MKYIQLKEAALKGLWSKNHINQDIHFFPFLLSVYRYIFILFRRHALHSILLLSESSDSRKYAIGLRLLNSKLKKETPLSNFTVVGPIWVNSAKKWPWNYKRQEQYARRSAKIVLIKNRRESTLNIFVLPCQPQVLLLFPLFTVTLSACNLLTPLVILYLSNKPAWKNSN